MLQYTMDAEERMNRTRAGSNLEEAEKLSLLSIGYKPMLALDLPFDVDHFPEEEQLDELVKDNPSIVSQNFDRVSLSRYISSMRAMIDGEVEPEYLRSTRGIVDYMAHKTSREDYLRAIYHLIEEEGSDEVKSVDLADFLEISKPSVAEMLENLTEDGLVDKERYSGVKLTKKGLEEAKKITFKHRVIEVFLLEFLKVDKKNLHKEAHKLEHAFSDDVVKKLSIALNHPKKCPHGSPIPDSLRIK